MGKGLSKQPSQRQLRVGEEIRHTLANIVQRGELSDPELIDVSITISEVRVSPDLKKATIFYTPLGGGERAGLTGALGRAVPYLRHRIGNTMSLRFVPDLVFQRDRSFDYAKRIEEVLEAANTRDNN